MLLAYQRYPLAFCAFFLCTLSVPCEASSDLPSSECVQALRSANIERLNRNTLGQLNKLHGALEPCEPGISAVLALLQFHSRTPLSADEFAALSATLVKRTEQPGFELSLGVAQQLVSDPELGESILGRVVALLERRLADGERSPAETVRVLRVLGDAQKRLGWLDEYGETLEAIYSLDQADDVVWLMLGLYRELENWDRSLELLEGLVAKNPHLRASYVVMLAKAGRREVLMEEFEKLAQDAQPEVAEVSADDSFAALAGVAMFTSIATDLAWQIRATGHDQDAEAVFRRILDLNPNHPVARGALLHLYGSKEERASHQASLVARRAAETDPTALLNQGADLLAAKDYDAAYSTFLRVVEEFPGAQVLQSEAVWYNFGIAAYRIKNWLHADRGFAKALSFKARPQSLFFLGMAKVKLERYAEAIPILEQSLEQGSNQSAAHYQLWTCHAALGNKEAAARHLAAYQAEK